MLRFPSGSMARIESQLWRRALLNLSRRSRWLIFDGALQENGPCFVCGDSNSTYLNLWNWNNEVNMLYIDQPVQVGFSYDVLTNVTVNLAAVDDDFPDAVQPADFSNGVPAQNNTFIVRTMSNQSSQSAPNSTVHAAHALWHFA